MTEPRTVAGRAAISAMRPFVRRALAQTIVSIEDEAAAPYLEALREADRVLEAVTEAVTTGGTAPADLATRAAAARRLAAPLLATPEAPRPEARRPDRT